VSFDNANLEAVRFIPRREIIPRWEISRETTPKRQPLSSSHEAGPGAFSPVPRKMPPASGKSMVRDGRVPAAVVSPVPRKMPPASGKSLGEDGRVPAAVVVVKRGGISSTVRWMRGLVAEHLLF
ncbi:hypothetical protein T484DRAFT_1757174, partial [Baffinella frigidus]